ncbi:MAG: hypothetical protein P8080_09350 [Gammaproteobacteria bacterium]
MSFQIAMFAPISRPTVVLFSLLLSACDYWPEKPGTLAGSLTEQLSADVTVWRVGGDVVLVDVANSSLYGSDAARLKIVATDIAERVVAAVERPVATVAVTFHESEVSEDVSRMREFAFLVKKGQPILQPRVSFDATGPLTLDEIQANFLSLAEAPPAEERKDCILGEIEARARAAGDPETLDPKMIEFLPAKSWRLLDKAGRRIVLMQAITTKASLVCGSQGDYEGHPGEQRR